MVEIDEIGHIGDDLVEVDEQLHGEVEDEVDIVDEDDLIMGVIVEIMQLELEDDLIIFE